MVENKYWTVLNSHLLADVLGKVPKGDMKILNEKANQVKHELQTYGPMLGNQGTDFRANKGKAAGEVFHSDMRAGAMYVLEWAVLDVDKRIIALLGFAKHENYPYQKKPLTADQKSKILSAPCNQKILDRVEVKLAEAKHKGEEIALNMNM